MRSPALPLLAVLGCASPSSSPAPPAEQRLDPRMAILDELQSVGLPSPLGWTRLEHVGPRVRGEPCDHCWEQPGGLHHVRVHDDLSVDYDGQWFSQWPAAMRVPAGTYEHAVLRWARKPAASVVPATTTRPGDVLREAASYVHSRPRCAGARVLGTELDAVVLATQVRAMGHTELAQRIVSHWPPVWSAARLRFVVATAVASSARRSFAQGMPRTAVRALLARADTLCDCGGLPEVRAFLDGLGDDPSRAYDPHDPESMLDWLVDDLVLLAATPADELGWRETATPRSPGLELIAMGWAALPAVVARAGDRRWMRAAPQLRAGDVAVAIAAEIARHPFMSAGALARWWAEHRGSTEFEAMTANLAGRTPEPALQRLLELDPEHAVSRLVVAWPDLPEPAHRGLVAASFHLGEEPATATKLEPLLLVALRDEDLVTASSAASALAEGRNRGWVRTAVERARPLVRGLARPTAPAEELDDEAPLTTLIVAIATVDRDAALPLLRDALRRERADPRGVGARALALLCTSLDEDPAPACPDWAHLARSPTRRRR